MTSQTELGKVIGEILSKTSGTSYWDNPFQVSDTLNKLEINSTCDSMLYDTKQKKCHCISTKLLPPSSQLLPIFQDVPIIFRFAGMMQNFARIV